MDAYKQEWTRLQNEIFRFLCIKSDQDFNLRGISKFLDVSPTAVSKALKQLEEKKLIKIEKSKVMNLMSIKLNRDNYSIIELKRTENLKLIYESNLVDFVENKFPGCTIILFGSYSRGEDIYSSDIDIAIIGSKEKDLNLSKYNKFLERDISLNFYSDWKIKNNLKNNILNGIILRGSIEL
jgi:predicted nucleotidyltransferase